MSSARTAAVLVVSVTTKVGSALPAPEVVGLWSQSARIVPLAPSLLKVSRTAPNALKAVATVAPPADHALTACQTFSSIKENAAPAAKTTPQREERISARKYNAPPVVPDANRPSPAWSVTLALDSARAIAAVV